MDKTLLQEKWTAMKANLKTALYPAAYDQWVLPLSVMDFDEADGVLYMITPETGVAFMDTYYPILTTAAEKAFGVPVKIRYRVEN